MTTQRRRTVAPARLTQLDFELITACDQSCGHCYNVWTTREARRKAEDPRLTGAAYLAMMEKAVRETRASQITITGGEPLLRKDALDIIEHACRLAPSVTLISNGSHFTDEVLGRLWKARVAVVQLTLLSTHPARHNLLKGLNCFDDTVAAARALVSLGIPVNVCFVSMHTNWRDFEDVMRLCGELGVSTVVYNRMSPTGVAVQNAATLMPYAEEVEYNLETAERLGPQLGLKVAAAMPILPCLIQLDRFPSIDPGYCSTNSDIPNITIDPAGNVRSCNLSNELLGNICRQSWEEIRHSPYFGEFAAAVAAVCQGCYYENSCQGGCKESTKAVFGDLSANEPLLHRSLYPEAATAAGWPTPCKTPASC